MTIQITMNTMKDPDVKQKAKVVIMILSTSSDQEYIKKVNEIKEVTGHESNCRTKA